MKKLLAIALLISLLTSLLPGMAFAQSGNINVQRYEFPVTLSDNQSYIVVGYLYTRQGNPNEIDQCGKRSNTLQVTLSGATYNHKYWDAPSLNNVDYSYARYMVGQCYSVLALDRLGTGESSKPAGDFITLAREADSIAQIVSSLRTNRNPIQRKFKRIVLVGHSFGSMLAVYTLGEYGNVADALVATGWIHAPGTVPLTPEYVGQLLQSEHIRVAPEVRSLLFYYPTAADPMVIANDNAALIDTLPRGYFLDGINLFTARALSDVAQIKALSKVEQVNVPTFVQLGEFDLLFPWRFPDQPQRDIASEEARFYSNAPTVQVDNLPNIGHGFNLHINHQEGWQHILNWIDAHVVNG